MRLWSCTTQKMWTIEILRTTCNVQKKKKKEKENKERKEEKKKKRQKIRIGNIEFQS